MISFVPADNHSYNGSTAPHFITGCGSKNSSNWLVLVSFRSERRGPRRRRTVALRKEAETTSVSAFMLGV